SFYNSIWRAVSFSGSSTSWTTTGRGDFSTSGRVPPATPLRFPCYRSSGRLPARGLLRSFDSRLPHTRLDNFPKLVPFYIRVVAPRQAKLALSDPLSQPPALHVCYSTAAEERTSVLGTSHQCSSHCRLESELPIPESNFLGH